MQRKHNSKSRFAQLPLYFAAFGLSTVSLIANARFGWSFGDTDIDRVLWSVASVSSDLAKPVAFAALLLAIADRNISRALTAGALVSICAVFSLAAAIGYSSSARSGKVTNAFNMIAGYERAARVLPVVLAQVEKLEAHKRYTATSSCTDITVEKSRAWCDENMPLLTEARATIRKSQITLSAGRPGSVDPQSETIAALLTRFGLSADSDGVRNVLSWLAVLLIEVGSLTAFALAGGRSGGARRPLPGQTIIPRLLFLSLLRALNSVRRRPSHGSKPDKSLRRLIVNWQASGEPVTPQLDAG